MCVGKTGFEPATPWSQTRCATGLRYSPAGFMAKTQVLWAVRAGFEPAIRFNNVCQFSKLVDSASLPPHLCPHWLFIAKAIKNFGSANIRMFLVLRIFLCDYFFRATIAGIYGTKTKPFVPFAVVHLHCLCICCRYPSDFLLFGRSVLPLYGQNHQSVHQ